MLAVPRLLRQVRGPLLAHFPVQRPQREALPDLFDHAAHGRSRSSSFPPAFGLRVNLRPLRRHLEALDHAIHEGFTLRRDVPCMPRPTTHAQQHADTEDMYRFRSLHARLPYNIHNTFMINHVITNTPRLT